MTIGCSFDWNELCDVAGHCIRPGGHILTARALELCRLPPGSHVIDVGSGAGGTLAYLEQIGNYYQVGLDCSGTLLGESASRLTTSTLVRGYAENLPFREGAFDALFLECVLSVFHDRMAALFESVRVLKDGGYLIMSDVFSHGEQKRQTSGDTLYQLPSEGLFTKDDILCTLKGLELSLLAWEEHDRFLREFVGRMILTGRCLPDIWGCKTLSGETKKTDKPKISYFLLVVRKGCYYE